MYVVKRDGRRELFNPEKIYQAVEKAFLATQTANVSHWAKIVTDRVVSELEACYGANEGFEIEKIQDKVEDVLMVTGNTNVARAYIRYRFQHEIIRNQENDQGKFQYGFFRPGIEPVCHQQSHQCFLAVHAAGGSWQSS